MLRCCAMNNRVLIFRNGSIGNTLVAIPAIRALRKNRPNWHISLLVDKTGLELLKHCPYIDELILYDKKGEHKSFIKYIKFILSLRKKRFTYALLYKRFFRNELIAFLSGIKNRYGYKTEGKRNFFLHKTIPYIETKNIVELNLDLLNLLNIQSSDTHLEIWWSLEDEKYVISFLKNAIFTNFVIFHSGGKTVQKTKTAISIFADLCDILLKYKGIKPIFISATEEELEEIQQIGRLTNNKIVIAHRFSLPKLACLISKAKLFIGNDSGPAHIAKSTNIPIIIFYNDDEKVLYNNLLDKWMPSGENVWAIVNNTIIDQVRDNIIYNHNIGSLSVVPSLIEKYLKGYTIE